MAPAILLFLLLVACGNSADKGGGPKKPGTKPTDQGQNGCPASVPSSFHRITLRFSRPLPAKLGLKLDIDRDVRVSDCADIKQAAPIVSISRTAGSNDLTVEVDHQGFYNPLPRDASFEIYDLGNCGSSIQPFYTLRAQALYWKMDFPNGPTCAGRAMAVVDVIPLE